MFSYDGHSILENTTTRALRLNDLTSGNGALLKDTCEYALDYAYGARGGSRICVTSSPSLCLSAPGYSPGSELEFVDNSDVLFTYIYKCMPLGISNISRDSHYNINMI